MTETEELAELIKNELFFFFLLFLVFFLFFIPFLFFFSHRLFNLALAFLFDADDDEVINNDDEINREDDVNNDDDEIVFEIAENDDEVL